MPSLAAALEIIGMEDWFPAYVPIGVAAEPGEFIPAFVVIVEIPVFASGPHDLRHCVCKLAESGFTGKQRCLDAFLFGDIARDFRYTDNVPLVVLYGRYRQRD